MFRFSIRDLLWLMVVVGMGIVLANSVRSLRIMQLKCSDLEDEVELCQSIKIEVAMFRLELEKATGRSIFGFDWQTYPADQGKIVYKIRSLLRDESTPEPFGEGELRQADIP